MSFFEVFQPELRYLREERDRQKMLIARPTTEGGAPLGIDLDSGIATITVRPKAAPTTEAEPEPKDSGTFTPPATDPVALPSAQRPGPDGPA